MMFDGPTHALSVTFHEKSEGRVGRIRGNADLGHDVLYGMVDAGSAIPLACTCLKKDDNRCQTSESCKCKRIDVIV